VTVNHVDDLQLSAVQLLGACGVAVLDHHLEALVHQTAIRGGHALVGVDPGHHLLAQGTVSPVLEQAGDLPLDLVAIQKLPVHSRDRVSAANPDVKGIEIAIWIDTT